MAIVLFIVGLLTALACGWNSVASTGVTWKEYAVWSLSAFGGAALMVLAIILRGGAQ